MRQWILVVFLALYAQDTICKSIEKPNRKKLSLLKRKPTKGPKSAIEAFTSLPPSDLQFIKELDKQFKLHGENVKIKIQRENTTAKNTKRTIDGELGYGYHGVGGGPTYHFEMPRYMLYPYSQHDIPPTQGKSISRQHQIYEKTSVTIEPSQAFEIKEISGGYETYDPHHQPYVPQHGQQAYISYQPVPQYVEPVIVLRIPGPTKYAAHLQSLLQQYLEIRASQYLKALQESEGQYQHVDSYQPQHQTQYQPEAPQYHQPEAAHYQREAPTEEVHPPSAPGHSQFQPIEQVYENVHYQQQEKPQQNPDYQVQVSYESQDTNSAYEQHSHDQSQQYVYDQESRKEAGSSYHRHGGGGGYQYQTPMYVTALQPAAVPISAYGPPVHMIYMHNGGHLPISENYPRSTHTKVLFTNGENDDHSTNYALPKLSKPSGYQPAPKIQYNYVDTSSDYDKEESIVSITQRPFNYHAHAAKQGLKRDARTSDDQYRQQLSKLYSRLKKKNVVSSVTSSDRE